MKDAGQSSEPVDFVVMWVDGSDPETAQARDRAVAELRAAGRPVKDSPNRHRDNGELLFLLRAIEAHMPWFRQIVLVTNGQWPSYLDRSADSIRLVSHAEIFPPGFATPSFNTYAIDSCVSRIDGLSETFVRFSDDFLVCKAISKREFLGQDRLGVNLVGSTVFNTGTSEYLTTLQNNAIAFWEAFGYLPLANFLHVPQLRNRRILEQMNQVWPEWIARTRGSRFRDVADLNLLCLYPYFALHRHRPDDLALLSAGKPAPGIVDLSRLPDPDRLYVQVQAGGASDWRAAMNRVVREPPRFLNVNDDLGPLAAADDQAYVGGFLNRLYPTPSSLEIEGAPFPGYAASCHGSQPGGLHRPTRLQRP